MNSVNLVGRLTKDVDMKYTSEGTALSTFTLAVNRPWKNQKGENEADFIRIVVWRKPAENVANYCKKGSQVGVTGRIQTRSFEGENGKMVYMTEVVANSVEFLDTRNGNGNKSGSGQSNQSQPNPYQNENQNQGQGNPSNHQSNDPFKGQGQPIDISDDDLPF